MLGMYTYPEGLLFSFRWKKYYYNFSSNRFSKHIISTAAALLVSLTLPFMFHYEIRLLSCQLNTMPISLAWSPGLLAVFLIRLHLLVKRLNATDNVSKCYEHIITRF